MNQDEIFMQRCFELARLGAGQVSPNPMVGAVLVHEGLVIGEGWHQAWGAAHAEVNCFDSVKPKHQPFVRHATLYCSLEPCSHFGKTPPCADLVCSKQVKRVVVSNTDPNPLVAGKGLAKLRAAGIEVTEGVLEAEGKWLNRAFFTWITRQRPYIILKWAESADGYLGEEGQRSQITGPLVQRLLHRWRATTDAILIGANTAITDDPRLDARLYFGKNPLRVLLDGRGNVPLDRKILSDEHPALIFSPEREGLPPHKTLIPSTGVVDLSEVLDALKNQQRATLLVEGGALVLQQFLDQGLWDEIRVFKSPLRLQQGIKAPHLPPVTMRERYLVGEDEVAVYWAGA